jgi:hypothetical protein
LGPGIVANTPPCPSSSGKTQDATHGHGGQAQDRVHSRPPGRRGRSIARAVQGPTPICPRSPSVLP